MKLNCTNCQKPLSIDETKLPMKEVSFPCPSCKTKLSVDRRKLEAGEEAVPAAVVAAVDEGEDDYGDKALLVGNDTPALRQAARSLGYSPLHFPAADAARDFYTRDYPPIVIVSPAQLTPPPLQEIAPLTSVSPADRRRGFYILVADNLRTHDGNAAFLYGVNLVVATKDLGSIASVYKDAVIYHKRLYHAINVESAAREKGEG